MKKIHSNLKKIKFNLKSEIADEVILPLHANLSVADSDEAKAKYTMRSS